MLNNRTWQLLAVVWAAGLKNSRYSKETRTTWSWSSHLCLKIWRWRRAESKKNERRRIQTRPRKKNRSCFSRRRRRKSVGIGTGDSLSNGSSEDLSAENCDENNVVWIFSHHPSPVPISALVPPQCQVTIRLLSFFSGSLWLCVCVVASLCLLLLVLHYFFHHSSLSLCHPDLKAQPRRAYQSFRLS